MTNPYEPPTAPVSDQPSTSRGRPWFMTAWLGLMIVATPLLRFDISCSPTPSRIHFRSTLRF